MRGLEIAKFAPLVQSAWASDLNNKCTDFSLPAHGEFNVLSTRGRLVSNYTAGDSISPVSFCNLSVTLTHPGVNDIVNNEIWLPTDGGWNGRFVATGGGGFVAGYESYLPEYIAKGYATALTDAGLTLNGTIDSSTGAWALDNNKETNWPLVTNFAYRSIHDMTVVAKHAIKRFYGKAAHHSYYSGCSTGGRMGYFSAEHYPDDFDGILANAPAIHSSNLSVGMEWPTAVMHEGEPVPQCILEAYQQTFIAECDELDGVKDGLISQPERCHYDPRNLVGAEFKCSSGTIVVTEGHANSVAQITRGPHSRKDRISWFGTTPGTPYETLANTTTEGNVTRVVPSGLGESWFKYFVAKDPSYSLEDFNVKDFNHAYVKSFNEFSWILGSQKPDLRAFHRGGHKLLTWHGLADEYISHEGTTWYRNTLMEEMDLKSAETDIFYRLFLAPGVHHCNGGYGPQPVEPFDVLVRWVEEGHAPDTLPASLNRDDGLMTRNLCRYPQQLVYKGGDVDDADSFTCQ